MRPGTAMNTVGRFTLLGLVSASLIACGKSDEPQAGEEKGACYPNGTCNEGLVCASEICVDLYGDASSDGPASGAASSEGDEYDGEGLGDCIQSLHDCYGGGSGQACIAGYVNCADEYGPSRCESFEQACAEIEYDDPGCDQDSEFASSFCSGGGDDEVEDEPWGTSGGQGGSEGGSASGGGTDTDSGGHAGSGGDGNDGDQCPTPGCSAYAAKLSECWPTIDADWLEECRYVYDICDAAGCLSGTAGQVACVNSHSCEEITDGVCNQKDAC